jgi:pimeloyl-ACP methyl ester carboxylesterase
MPAFGEDVVAVVEHLGLGNVVLIGHSMGGVVVETALRLRDQVVGVVWADTYNTLGDPLTREELEEFLVPFRADFVTATRDLVRRMFGPDADADLVEWVAADMSAAPPEIAIDALEHAVSNDRAILAGLRGADAARRRDQSRLSAHRHRSTLALRGEDRGHVPGWRPGLDAGTYFATSPATAST